ncbi:MAG: hypothetical protein ACRC6V_05835, partial [Bacteroidales bacterium]
LMANFFEGVGKALMHPINEAKWMFDSTKDVIKGDMKLKDIPGSHQRDVMNDITVPILGDNKIAKNSDAIAGAVVGGILAAPLLAGGGASASASAPSAFSLGDVSGYMKPGKIAQAMQNGPNSLSASGTPDVSTWNKIKGQASSLFDTGEKNLGALYDDVDFEADTSDDLIGAISEHEDDLAAAKKIKDAETSKKWEQFAEMLKTIKPAESPRLNMSSGRVGGGFSFDRKPYENQLLTREYQELYNQPLYTKVTK